jgi:hypothetical protein
MVILSEVDECFHSDSAQPSLPDTPALLDDLEKKAVWVEFNLAEGMTSSTSLKPYSDHSNTR